MRSAMRAAATAVAASVLAAGSAGAQSLEGPHAELERHCREDREAIVVIDNLTGEFWNVTAGATHREARLDSSVLATLFGAEERTDVSLCHCHPVYPRQQYATRLDSEIVEDPYSSFAGMVPSGNDIETSTETLAMYTTFHPRGQMSFCLVGAPVGLPHVAASLTFYGFSPESELRIRASASIYRRYVPGVPALTSLAAPVQVSSGESPLAELGRRYAREYDALLGRYLPGRTGVAPPVWRATGDATAVFGRFARRLEESPIRVRR